MKQFWGGFEKQAISVKIMREGAKKALKKPENVLDYKAMSKAKPKVSGETIDYKKFSKSMSGEDMPLWKKKLEAKRQEIISKSKGVYDTMPRAALPVA